MEESPRGTVLRIEALAVTAIIMAFFLAAFGSCRRWSNRWIVQKGFPAAHAFSLSLGTYSIGLMQSSWVKSEMYPIWTVSLFTLFACVDPVISYNGLDYKGPLSKVVYGIFLNCAYVLLMSISTASSAPANAAIITLSAITFFKAFHRSLALVQQKKMRNMLPDAEYEYHSGSGICVPRKEQGKRYGIDITVSIATGISGISVLRKEEGDESRSNIIVYLAPVSGSLYHVITLGDIDSKLETSTKAREHVERRRDVCDAFCLSHELQRHFLGFGRPVIDRKADPETPNLEGIDYKRALEVIEIELAFLYEVFFTGNPFHHFYQAETASVWASASLVGICFVGVVAAIPGAMTRHPTAAATTTSTSSGHVGCTNVFVGTTTADLVVTFGILVSLALLQLMHLIRCWTSNWARLAVVCAYARRKQETWWLRLKWFVAYSTNWFEKYLWQNKIGQYSMLPDGLAKMKKLPEGRLTREGEGTPIHGRRPRRRITVFSYRLVSKLGLDYIWEVLWDLLGSDTNKTAAVKLDDDVKASVIDFLRSVDSKILEERTWSSWHNRIPFYPGEGYTSSLIEWHTATWFCELAEQEEEKKKDNIARSCRPVSYLLNRAVEAVAGVISKPAAAAADGGERQQVNHRHVANALSKYCAYLLKVAPELLPGAVQNTRDAYSKLEEDARRALRNGTWQDLCYEYERGGTEHVRFGAGMSLANDLRRHLPAGSGQIWETLARVWVQMLVYAAPYGRTDAHMQRLSQGGEFITHLWALLYHLGIREWVEDETAVLAV